MSLVDDYTSISLEEKGIPISYNGFLKIQETSENIYEYIDGKMYPMASVSTYHQYILDEILFEFKMYLKSKELNCEAFSTIDVLDVKKDDNKKKHVIPDIVIACDMEKFIGGKYNGIPNLIVEIVSPSNSHMDFIKKRIAYEELGVKEYWIIDSRIGQVGEVVAYKYSQDYNNPLEYKRGDCIESDIFEGLRVNLKPIFEKVIKLV